MDCRLITCNTKQALIIFIIARIIFLREDARYNNVKHKFSSYHIIGLAALDQVNEFCHDKDTKMVYYKPPHGKDPNTMDLSGTGQRFFGIDLNKCSQIQIQDITFEGAGFWVHQCEQVLIRDCVFDYPRSKFMLGELAWFENYNPHERSKNKMSSFYEGKK